MPSNQHDDDVHLAEFVGRKFRRPDGNTPFNPSKAEIKERRERHSGEILYYDEGQQPEFNPTTIRKRACPICNFSNGRLMATCYRCRACFACGSYCGPNKDDLCNTCGNFNSSPPPEQPTIIIG